MTDQKECIFCTMDEVTVLWDGLNFYVAVNIRPIIFGHLLVVPKEHVAEIKDLDNDLQEEASDIVACTTSWLRDRRGDMNRASFDLPADHEKRSIKDHAHIHVHPAPEGLVYRPAEDRPLISKGNIFKMKALFKGFQVYHS